MSRRQFPPFFSTFLARNLRHFWHVISQGFHAKTSTYPPQFFGNSGLKNWSWYSKKVCKVYVRKLMEKPWYRSGQSFAGLSKLSLFGFPGLCDITLVSEKIELWPDPECEKVTFLVISVGSEKTGNCHRSDSTVLVISGPIPYSFHFSQLVAAMSWQVRIAVSLPSFDPKRSEGIFHRRFSSRYLTGDDDAVLLLSLIPLLLDDDASRRCK